MPQAEEFSIVQDTSNSWTLSYRCMEYTIMRGDGNDPDESDDQFIADLEATLNKHFPHHDE